MNAPTGVAADSTGNLSVADRLNQRTRGAALATLAVGAFAALEVQLTVLTLLLVGMLILERRQGWGRPGLPARG